MHENNDVSMMFLYDDSIVIRPSDKSPGVVILNREDYELEIEK